MDYSDRLIYIQRYLTNEMSSSEEHVFFQWLDGDEQNRLLYEQLESIWENARFVTKEEFNYENAYKRHISLLNLPQDAPKGEAKVMTPTFIRSLAAMLIFIIASMVVFKWLGRSQVHKSGEENISVTLDDGTKVWLSKNSELNIISITSDTRLVRLVGKAFFDVTHQEINPFRIETNHADIKVIGTKLLVDTRSELVSVKNGKVEVYDAVNKVILTENQSVSFKDKRFSQVKNTSFDNEMLWFNEELKFDNAPFDKVISDISKEYNLSIGLPSNSDWKDCLFTSGPLKGNTFEQILIILEVTYELQYTKISETSYQFTKVNCK